MIRYYTSIEVFYFEIGDEMKKRVLISIAFGLYLFVLMYLLFFSHYRFSVHGIIDYNLTPFNSILRDLNKYDGLSFSVLTNNLFGNILAFLPFGFLLPFIISKANSHFRIITLSAFSSLGIELMQFVFKLGAFDIDDIILNTIGGWTGYIIFKIFTYLYKLIVIKNEAKKYFMKN